MPYYPIGFESWSDSTPANPAGTTSLVFVMSGLARTFIPRTTGRVLLLVSGNMGNTLTADGVGVQLSYGTDAAPANGGALAGTQVGGLVTFTALTGVLTVPFALQACPTGLAIGTTHWVDLAIKAITAGTASVTNLALDIIEL